MEKGSVRGMGKWRVEAGMGMKKERNGQRERVGPLQNDRLDLPSVANTAVNYARMDVLL